MALRPHAVPWGRAGGPSMSRRNLIALLFAAAVAAAPSASRACGNAREHSASAEESVPAPSLSERLGGSLDVRHRVEPLLPTGPGDGARFGVGEVGVRVPVTGPLHLRGGVRLHYEDDPARPAVELDTIPTVGFELRF